MVGLPGRRTEKYQESFKKKSMETSPQKINYDENETKKKFKTNDITTYFIFVGRFGVEHHILCKMLKFDASDDEQFFSLFQLHFISSKYFTSLILKIVQINIILCEWQNVPFFRKY